jgi:hypothetical protein
VVRDAHGLLHRVESAPTAVSATSAAIILPLQPQAGRGAVPIQGDPRYDGPLELALLWADVLLPAETVLVDGLAGILTLGTSAGAEGPWEELRLGDGGGWRAQISTGGPALEDVEQENVIGATVDLGGIGALQVGQLVFLPPSLVSGADLGDVPVIANRAFLEDTSSAVGETVTVRLEGAHRRLSITGVVETFPTTDPARPLLLFDQPTLALLRLEATAGVRDPDEYWIATRDGAEDGVTAALREAPFQSRSVVGFLDRTRALSSDPVALGVIGALALGFAVTGLFAVVGLVVSGAVSARQRRTEFALLRALGLSGRQLFGSLWLDNGSVVLVSLVAGTGLGLVMAWIALPFITVTQAAVDPVPPVIVEMPWDRILGLEILSAVALAVAVVLIGTVLRRLGVGGVLRMGED